MRKKILLSLALVVLIPYLIGTPKKKTNIRLGTGPVFSKYQFLAVDLGFEIELIRSIYIQLCLDYLISAGSIETNGRKDDSLIIGINGEYKGAVSDKISIVISQGILLSYTESSKRYKGDIYSYIESKFGLNLGGGIEYNLNPKLSIYTNASYHNIVGEYNFDGFKIILGILVRTN